MDNRPQSLSPAIAALYEKRNKFIRTAALISVFPCLLGLVAGAQEGGVLGALGAFLLMSVMAFLLSFLAYHERFGNFKKIIEWLQSIGRGHVGDDINFSQYTFPNSKLICGRQAFYCDKPCVLVPYSEVFWIYRQVTKTYGVKTAEHYCFGVSNGEVYTLPVKEADFDQLYSRYIYHYSSNVILGFGDAQHKQFIARCQNKPLLRSGRRY